MARQTITGDRLLAELEQRSNQYCDLDTEDTAAAMADKLRVGKAATLVCKEAWLIWNASLEEYLTATRRRKNQWIVLANGTGLDSVVQKNNKLVSLQDEYDKLVKRLSISQAHELSTTQQIENPSDLTRISQSIGGTIGIQTMATLASAGIGVGFGPLAGIFSSLLAATALEIHRYVTDTRIRASLTNRFKDGSAAIRMIDDFTIVAIQWSTSTRLMSLLLDATRQGTRLEPSEKLVEHMKNDVLQQLFEKIRSLSNPRAIEPIGDKRLSH